MTYNHTGLRMDYSRKLLLITAILVAGLLAALAMVRPTFAATLDVNCADLPTAISSASAGDTLNVTGDCTLTTSTIVDKQLNIQTTSSTISTNGSAQIFVFTADGSTFSGFNVIKTDKVSQNIIGIQGDNVSILNNDFSGQYTVAANDHTSRALEVSTTTGLNISGNTFNNLRQPAYVNDFTTGVINNNYVNETRGFVVLANTDISFNGNTWGNNALDIALIAPGTVPNNYTCAEVDQISIDNNNADVQNQAQVTPCATRPTGLTWTNPNVTCGGTTTSSTITADWADSANAVAYEYWVTTPGAHNESNPWTTIVASSQNPGTFNEGEGVYTYKVRAQNAAGEWSAYSSTCTINYDAPALPALTYPSNKDACKNGKYATFTGKTFKNQGECVSWVAANENASFKRQ